MMNTDYLRELLGAQHGETVLEAAERVVRERDQFAMKLQEVNNDLEYKNVVCGTCDWCSNK